MRRLLAGLLCAVLAADPVHALTVILYARKDRPVVDCLARLAAIYGPVDGCAAPARRPVASQRGSGHPQS